MLEKGGRNPLDPVYGFKHKDGSNYFIGPVDRSSCSREPPSEQTYKTHNESNTLKKFFQSRNKSSLGIMESHYDEVNSRNYRRP
jgi:hypothetical protein